MTESRSMQALRVAREHTLYPKMANNPEIRMMWIKVVIQATRDAISRNIVTRANILKWMTSTSFPEVCRHAGVKGPVLKAALDLLLRGVETSPRPVMEKAQKMLEADLRARTDNLFYKE